MASAIYMLNVLWFKADGGKEKYRDYGEAVAPLTAKAGAELVEGLYVPEESLIGEWDPDLIFFVKYPSKEAFDTMIKSPEYAKVAPLREAALEKSLLLRCNSRGDM